MLESKIWASVSICLISNFAISLPTMFTWSVVWNVLSIPATQCYFHRAAQSINTTQLDFKRTSFPKEFCDSCDTAPRSTAGTGNELQVWKFCLFYFWSQLHGVGWCRTGEPVAVDLWTAFTPLSLQPCTDCHQCITNWTWWALGWLKGKLHSTYQTLISIRSTCACFLLPYSINISLKKWILSLGRWGSNS